MEFESSTRGGGGGGGGGGGEPSNDTAKRDDDPRPASASLEDAHDGMSGDGGEGVGEWGRE